MKRTVFVAVFMVTFLVLCNETTFVHAQANQVTIKPTNDTYTNSQNRNSNYGGQSYLEVQWYQINSSQIPNYQSIVFLKFNLSSIPIGAMIDGAVLQLYTTVVSETYEISACYISNNSWNELTLTRNGLDSLLPDPYLYPLYTILVGSSNQWYGWNVTDALNLAKIDNSLTEITLAIIAAAPYSLFSSVWFASKEYPVILTDYSPSLTIHWSAVIPEFSSVNLIPSFMIVTSLVAVFYRIKSKNPTQARAHSNS